MKILLVDDDSSIIQALLPALKTLPGHEVHVALSAEKALERVPAIGGVDLLITDVVMDPMDGFSLREQLDVWYPGLRTIFISGYDLSAYADRMNGSRLLNKPFGVEEFLANVQAVIEGRAAEPEPALEAGPVPVFEEQAPEEMAAPAAVVAEPEPEPEPVYVAQPVVAEEPAAAVEETLDPVVHHAGGSPSVPETAGAAELYEGGFEAAPNIAAHASMPVEEPLPPVYEPEAVAEPEPEPEPVVPPPVAVPVARPVAVKPTTKTISGINPVPAAVRAVARAATPVATPKAVAAPRATAVPGSLAAPKAVAAAQPSVPTVRATSPSAVPVAKSAAPTTVPVARAVAATPSAVPAARPVAANPTAVPVARPAAATPAATPVARPVAATPVAVPVARAVVATPAATPVARPAASTPAAVPVAKAVAATPAAVPVAKAAAVPVPVARPSAAPKAVPAAPTAKPAAPAAKPGAPTARPAVPTAKPVAQPAPSMRAEAPPMHTESVVPAPKRETHASSAHLIGQTIGGYQIVSQLGEGRWGSVFAAVQTSINRPVGLKVLSPDYAADEAERQRFTADARAKAHVQHPGILSVYEAGSADDWTFYTQEFVDGQNLEEMALTGRRIDEPTALKLLKTAADGLAYLAKNNIPHTPFHPSDIYLGVDGQPRLSNLATQLADQPIIVEQEIESLGRALLAVIDAGAAISTTMRALLGRTLRTHAHQIKDWNVLLQGVKALEPKVIPVEAAKISAQERAALATVEKARKQQKRAFLYNVIALFSLVLLATGAGWYVWFNTNERNLDEQIHIPAGEFIMGESKTATTGEFWIDKYEVTIGEYAKFVKWIDLNVGEQHAFDHPKQPRQLTHIPSDWTIYYGQAHRGGAAHSAPISLNSPMMMVTWWDAYAYAKWLGRELPTEAEWEKAARGERGFTFPWGDEAEPKRANTNADYDERHPGAKAGVDGFNYWGDVDRQKKDKSPYGVIGMAGNVSEWIVDWVDTKPVIKGGNFSVGLQPLSSRVANRMPDDAQEFIGFRTVTHKSPEAK